MLVKIVYNVWSVTKTNNKHVKIQNVSRKMFQLHLWNNVLIQNLTELWKSLKLENINIQ